MEQTEVGLDDVRRLGDVELMSGLHRLVCANQALTARLLVHLGEVDARGLYREHAFPSMFAYAVEELHMSEAEAYLRIQAARLGREFPLVLQMLAKGELHLTAIKLLGSHLTMDNHAQVLERARFKGKREIELVVAELAPKPDVASVIRKLPEPAGARATNLPILQLPVAAATDDRDRKQLPQPAAIPDERNRGLLPQPSATPTTDRNLGDADPEPLQQSPVVQADGRNRELLARSSVAAMTADRNADDCDREAFQLKAPRARVSSTTPLRPGRYEVKFTAGQTMQGKLEHLKNLLRHQVPDGNLAIILERAVDLLIEKTMKERFAQSPRRRRGVKPSGPTRVSDSQLPASTTSDGETEGEVRAQASERAVESKPPAPPAVTASARGIQAHSRYVPRSVVREVHDRDGEQCTFVSPNGRRCTERGFLELHHHDTPYAKGGAATAANLRTVCRAHNALLAERDFGRAFMQSKLARARLRKRENKNRLGPGRQQE